MVRYGEVVKKAPDSLVESCLVHVLDTGLHGLSLRPLGAAVGVSDRMLMYHFGSKDGLISQVVALANRRLIEHVGVIRSDDTAPVSATVRRAWTYLTSAEGAKISGLYLDLCSLSARDPARWAPALRDLRASWIAAIGSSEANPDLQRLVVGAVDGLLLDRLTTGDFDRVDAALDALLSLLESA